MPVAWQSTVSPPSPVPRPLSFAGVVVAMVCSVRQVAFIVLVVLSALEIKQLVCAALNHTAPFCSGPVRELDAELAACCCISLVVFGDALQASSSRKYCKYRISAIFFNVWYALFVTYVASCSLLLRVLDTVELVDTRAVSARVTTESDVQGLKEGVAASE
jgi:hypothetical protein